MRTERHAARLGHAFAHDRTLRVSVRFGAWQSRLVRIRRLRVHDGRRFFVAVEPLNFPWLTRELAQTTSLTSSENIVQALRALQNLHARQLFTRLRRLQHYFAGCVGRVCSDCWLILI